jgi:Peptidase family S41
VTGDRKTVRPWAATRGGAGLPAVGSPWLLTLAATAWCLSAAAAELPPAPPTAAPLAIPPDLMDPTFAPTLGRHWPPSTVLQRVETVDSEMIWASAQPSIARIARLDLATRLVKLDHFGRKVDAELRAALGPIDGLILDLRHNHGGSVRRMLQVAARFTGPVAAALSLIAEDGATTVFAIPDPSGPVWPGRLTVLVGDDTISSGEVLAGLLRRYGHASVLGARTWGKDFAMRVEQIDHDWRALVPAGRIEIPGEALHGGLIPDGPIPPELLARLEEPRPPAGRPGATEGGRTPGERGR